MKRRNDIIGRWVLALVGICAGCCLYSSLISSLPNKVHAAILGGLAAIFLVTDNIIRSIIGHAEHAQKTKVLANREYEMLSVKLEMYRGIANSFLLTNLFLKIVAGVTAAILLIDTMNPVWPCMIGYGAMGWSVLWFFYHFAAYRKLSNFRAKLDELERNEEVAVNCLGKIQAPAK